MRSVYRAIPPHWQAAHETLKDRHGNEILERSLGYETRLARMSGVPGDEIALIHYRTAIVRFSADDSVVVTTGGYYSATTKARIKAALRGSSWSIAAERGVWYWYRFDGERCERFCEFEDGDRVYLEPGRPGQDGIFE